MESLSFIETSMEDKIGFITLNRPKQYNALNRQMIREIVAAAEEFDDNPHVQVILLSGNGQAFRREPILRKWRERAPSKWSSAINLQFGTG